MLKRSSLVLTAKDRVEAVVTGIKARTEVLGVREVQYAVSGKLVLNLVLLPRSLVVGHKQIALI